MEAIAELFHAAIVQKHDIRGEVGSLRERFGEVQYGYSVSDLG
jgi:hypothetical protein